MKTCPFCKEQINDDAIKCRFCQSMLLPVQVPEQKSVDDGRVTYVLDRDLIRFAKFAVAVLAVFLVVGVYLFGFKLESTLEKVKNTQDQLKATQEKLSTAQRDLEAAQFTVRELKKDVEAVLAEAKGTLGVISEQKDAAVAMVVSIRNLTPPQSAALQKIKAEQPDMFRKGTKSKYWAIGATLRILFMDGDKKDREIVMEAAEEWAKYANIKFRLVESGDAEIRVSFKGPGYSYFGTDALAIPKKEPTMNFIKDSGTVLSRPDALQNFGTALGLIPEHQNPNAKIRWNKELVYRELTRPPNNWTKEMVNSLLFAVYSQDSVGPYRDFDPDSIMARDIPATWTGGVTIGGKRELSESDKALIARIYPRDK